MGGGSAPPPRSVREWAERLPRWGVSSAVVTGGRRGAASGSRLEQLYLVRVLQRGLRRSEEGAAGVVDQVQLEAGALHAVARRVEALQAQDAAIKDASPALRVHVGLRVARQAGHHVHLVVGEELHEVLLPGLQQHSEVAAVEHLPAQRARLAHQEAELREGKVAVVDGLPTLLAHDAHADIRGLDHRHVVGAVADAQHLGGHLLLKAALPGNHALGVPHRQLHLVVLHQPDDARLLAGRGAADHHAAAVGAQLREQRLQVGAQDMAERVAVHHELVRLGAGRRPGWRALDRSLFAAADGAAEGAAGGPQVLAAGGVRHRVPGVDLQQQLVQTAPAREVAVRVAHQRVVRRLEQLAGSGDVDGCLLLVTGDHPHLDAAVQQGGNGLRDALLKLVFNGSHAHKLKLRLHLVLQQRHLLLAPVH
mmetsp:Transcript_26182/g.67338  ORF Transcript_26182/g.67338 Transcript_26182/m.67338 type:complete len:422 (-) Transcript_26182:24-1289(-)